MKYFTIILVLFSFNCFSDDYVKGFIDGYYKFNKFDPKVNPCKKMDKILCSKQDTKKDCAVKQKSRNVSCDIYHNAKKMSFLVK